MAHIDPDWEKRAGKEKNMFAELIGEYTRKYNEVFNLGMREGEASGEARGIEIGEARGIEIGEARGEARGKAAGKNEGEIQGLCKMTLVLLEDKFGEIPGELREMIAKIEDKDIFYALPAKLGKCQTPSEFARVLENLAK